MISLEIDDGVARVTIDRPAVLNALDETSENELIEIWERLEDDRSVFLAVLTGAGDKAFCVGADLHAPGRTGLDYWAKLSKGGMGGIATGSRPHRAGVGSGQRVRARGRFRDGARL